MFTTKVVKHWNWRPRQVGSLQFSETSKMGPTKSLNNLTWLWTWSCLEQGVGLRDLQRSCLTSVTLRFYETWSQLLNEARHIASFQKGTGSEDTKGLWREQNLNQTIPGSHSDGKIPTESNCFCDSPLASPLESAGERRVVWLSLAGLL